MILVIGATGYVGRYFTVEMVKQGADVLALGRSKRPLEFLQNQGVKTQYFDLDIEESFNNLPKYGVDAIIDLSACLAELETPVQRFFDVNTIGAYKVLEYARRHDIEKVVIPSSHKLYNDVHGVPVISEETPISFTGDHSPYIISKIAAEEFINYYNKDFGLKAVALRFTGVHGYGEVLGHLDSDGTYKKSTFEIFVERALAGQKIEVWGDQSIKRDHVYIKDVVSALHQACIEKSASGVFNIASGIGYSQLDEARAINKVFGEGKSEIVECPDKQGLTRGYIYSIEKAKKELKWEPKYTDLEDMLVDYKYEWERKLYHNYHYFKAGQEPATL